MQKYIHNINRSKGTRKFLRKKSTPQEKILWSKLRNKNLKHKFKRQHGIGNFIADFYCPATKLVIELDGHQHLKNKEYDEERNSYFNSLNIKVIRFWNNEIENDLDNVIKKIQTSLNPSSDEEGR